MADESAQDYRIGQTIDGQWLILDIKRGGMGRVYICQQIGQQRYERGNALGVLKTPLKDLLLGSPEVMDSFFAEAANWISLAAHPNVVLAYGVEMHGRLPFIAMEYVEGGVTVADEIIEGRTTWCEALRVGLGAARGLAHAQKSAGLSHGDIKPQNVLLTRSGVAKVTDFGFSVSLNTGLGVSDGWLVGTRGFMAPEMYLGRTRPTEASDIYAFGMMLFSMATRHSPPAADPSGVFTPDIPGTIAELINDCVQREPSARPRAFSDIVERLEGAHRELLGVEPLPDSQPDLPAQVDALRNAALSWLNLGEWNKAESLAHRAIEADGTNWQAHSTLGLIRLEAADCSSALRSFEHAHALSPKTLGPVVNAVQANHGLGDVEATARWLRLAVRRAAALGTFESLDVISNVIADTLAPDDALRLCDAIVQGNAEAAITWNNRAILLRRAGRFDEALASAEHALAINPTYAKAWNNKSNALLHLARFGEALESAEQALQLDPLLTGPYLAKASSLAQMDRFADARTCIAEALRLKPGDPQLIRAQHTFSDAR